MTSLSKKQKEKTGSNNLKSHEKLTSLNVYTYIFCLDNLKFVEILGLKFISVMNVF